MKKTGRAMMGSMLFAAMLLGSSAAAELQQRRRLIVYLRIMQTVTRHT